jgi:hypothetical protein
MSTLLSVMDMGENELSGAIPSTLENVGDMILLDLVKQPAQFEHPC